VKVVQQVEESRVMKYIWKHIYTCCNPVIKAHGDREIALLEMAMKG